MTSSEQKKQETIKDNNTSEKIGAVKQVQIETTEIPAQKITEINNKSPNIFLDYQKSYTRHQKKKYYSSF